MQITWYTLDIQCERVSKKVICCYLLLLYSLLQKILVRFNLRLKKAKKRKLQKINSPPQIPLVRLHHHRRHLKGLNKVQNGTTH